MKDVEKSRTSFIRVNLRVLREKHLFQCPPLSLPFFCLRKRGLEILFLYILEVAVGIDLEFAGCQLVADNHSVRVILEG